MHVIVRFVLCLATLVGLLGGCGVSSSGPPVEARCTLSGQCPAGSYCGAGGTCVSECVIDDDCLSGEGLPGRCVARWGRCSFVTGDGLDSGVAPSADAPAVDATATPQPDLPPSTSADAGTSSEADRASSELDLPAFPAEARQGGGGARIPDGAAPPRAGTALPPPPRDVRLNCPWVAQLLPGGSWANTHTCGPASVAISTACLLGRSVSSDDVARVTNRLVAMGLTRGGAPDGEDTSLTDLRAVAADLDRVEIEVRQMGLADVQRAVVDEGVPVIVGVSTQCGARGCNDLPSRVMWSDEYPHFNVVIGIAADGSIITHDPGRGTALQGAARSWTASSFEAAWANRGRFWGGIVRRVSAPPPPTCIDMDGDGYGASCSRGPDCDDARAAVHPGAAETCDRMDNNCDGAIDQGCSCTPGATRGCYTGPSGTQDVGRCRAGTQSCVAGSGGVGSAWGACSGQTLPASETCNSADDNCDGRADESCPCRSGETRPCYTGPAGTQSVGVCRAGTQSCSVSAGVAAWGTCSGQTLPTSETCNSVDDNCDGRSDESCSCTPGVTRGCYTGPSGTQGVGICRAGTQSCVAGPGGVGSAWGTCSGQTLPASETCNSADDNCDGRADESCPCRSGETRPCYTGPAGTQSVGVCRAGTQSCSVSAGVAAWGTCSGQTLPTSETCNSRDDDCDNAVDDGVCACTVPRITAPSASVTTVARGAIVTISFVPAACSGARHEFRLRPVDCSDYGRALGDAYTQNLAAGTTTFSIDTRNLTGCYRYLVAGYAPNGTELTEMYRVLRLP